MTEPNLVSQLRMAAGIEGRPTIFILTAVFRDENLGKLAASIRPLTEKFNVHWIPVFDTMCGNWHAGAKYNAGLDIVDAYFKQMSMSESVFNSWIYMLDDDNLIHPEYGEALLAAIENRSLDVPLNKTMFIMNQFTIEGVARLEKPYVAPMCIDTGCVTMSAFVSQNKHCRWRLVDNTHEVFDYQFFNRVVKNNFVPQHVPGKTYYNAITNQSTGIRKLKPSDIKQAIQLEEQIYGEP